MQICRELAGYSFAHADVVRRAMAKKKPEVMQAERALFEEGAAAHGVSREAANSIFDEMVSFASYAFNKSHAAAYAVISYRTAYMKAHHPAAYMAALMTSVWGNAAKLGEYISECQHLGIAVLSPDINESGVNFSVAGDHIRFGLLALRNVGRQFIEQILTERRKGEFTDFADFVSRMSCTDMNRRAVEALIKSGAFDRLGVYRSRLLASYEKMLEDASARARSNLTGQLDLFSDTVAEAPSASYEYPNLPEFNFRELIMLEKESAGISFSGHLLDDYKRHADSLPHESLADVLQSYDKASGESEKYADKQRIAVVGMITKRVAKNTRSGDAMAFITLEDRFAAMEIVVFPKMLEKFGDYLLPDNAVLVKGELSLREDEDPKLLLSSVTPLRRNTDYADSAATPKKAPEKLYVRLPSLNGELFQRLLAFADANRGELPLVLYGEAEGRYVTRDGLCVRRDEPTLAGIRKLVGEKNAVAR